jgi:hypothetical protein
MGPTVIGGCAAPDPGCCAEGVVGVVGEADGVDGGTVVLEVSAEGPEPVAVVALSTGADDAGAAGPAGAAAAAELLDCGGRCGARMGTCAAPGGKARVAVVGDGDAGTAEAPCRGGRGERVAPVDAAESATELLDEVPAPEGAE